MATQHKQIAFEQDLANHAWFWSDMYSAFSYNHPHVLQQEWANYTHIGVSLTEDFVFTID